jgi:hypothetical protein
MRLSCFILALVLLSPAAFACSPAEDADGNIIDAYAAAKGDILFDGTVLSADNKKVTIRVDQGLKGVRNGDVLQAAQGSSTCHLYMEKNMQVSFSGEMQGKNFISGGFRLKPPAQAATGNNEQLIETGIIQGSCAPWDGAAFVIRLDSNVTASIYTSLESVARRKGRDVFKIGTGGDTGSIVSGCDSSGKNCTSGTGTVTIEKIDGDNAVGLIEIPETGERHMFRAVIDRHYQAICG